VIAGASKRGALLADAPPGRYAVALVRTGATPLAMHASSAHSLFLVALVCGTAMMLLPLWVGWPPAGDPAAAASARSGFAAGALGLAVAAAAMLWHWRRQPDPALARYRLWTALAIGLWAAGWALASVLVLFVG
jgi:hypothetical protein